MPGQTSHTDRAPAEPNGAEIGASLKERRHCWHGVADTHRRAVAHPEQAITSFPNTTCLVNYGCSQEGRV